MLALSLVLATSFTCWAQGEMRSPIPGSPPSFQTVVGWGPTEFDAKQSALINCQSRGYTNCLIQNCSSP